MGISAETKIQAGRLLAKDAAPYLSAALWSLVPFPWPGLGQFAYMALDEKYRLFYDPKTVEGDLEPKEIAAAILHEVSHLLREHCARIRAIAPDNHSKGNVAADLAVNPDLKDLKNGLKLPEGALWPATFGLEDGLTLEEYYHKLPSKPNKGGKGKNGPGNGNCGGCAGNPSEAEKAAQKAADAEGIGGKEKGERSLVERQVAEDIRAQNEKRRGTVPGSWERWAEEVLGPAKVDWRRELRAAIRSCLAARAGQVDYTFQRPSRRQQCVRGAVLPGMHAPVPDATVVVDTSGSMSNHQLSEALAEVGGVLRAAGGPVRVLSCDAAIQSCQEVWTPRQVKLKGGGGTSMAEAVRHCSRLRPPVSTLIVVTDGLTDWPAQEDCGRMRVVWAIVGPEKARPPVGTVIRVPD